MASFSSVATASLSSDVDRLTKYGPNGITDKEESLARKLLGYFTGPIAYMIEAAALVSAILGDWPSFAVIFGLLIINAGLAFWQDAKAANALAALKAGLAPQAKVLRDGAWSSIKAQELVPGDIVKVRLGDIVPADLRLIGEGFASIDQSALTGESVPVTKHEGDEAYSGSVVKEGEMSAVVIATGGKTFFGRTAKLVAGAGVKSNAQTAMFQIGNFLILVAVVLAAVLVIFQVWRNVHAGWEWKDALRILQFVLVLLVAAIPVAMPAVFSVTLALGALALSKKQAIVSRLQSIEEMAGVDILCTDKTGTLTKNQLTLSDPILLHGKDGSQVVLAGALASRAEDHDVIDDAVIAGLSDPSATKAWTVTDYTPFDPITKYTKAKVTGPDGQHLVVAKGAPAAIVKLAGDAGADADTVTKTVADLAANGRRALAVAQSTDDGATWQILGILPMSDPPRDDSKATIDAVETKGLSVKMITGDDTAIAIETAKELGMGTNILAAADVFPKDLDPDNVPSAIVDQIEKADGFARVFPEHKYAIVKSLQKRGRLVAMTGDGVNDAPALKQANCGTAVSGATDAARGAAALSLTAPGLSVINSAIDEARRIFGRITSYTIYRVALTLTIMFLVVIATILEGFQPLTPIMIVVLSLLDDIPIMTIAYDNTPVSKTPIRWNMRQLLLNAGVLGLFAVVQSLIMLLIAVGLRRTGALDVTTEGAIQTIVFLQLVTGGHLLIFVTRSAGWFFQRPFPAKQLWLAILATQIIAVLMAAFGWLVPAISWGAILLVLVYCLVWVFIMGAVRVVSDRMIADRTATHLHHQALVTQDLARAV
ncbi:H+-transporting ATPase [Branchiibius hedensis]|uniref:H+-transporting ATPase n=1 Tax=Branchiibius hedensis TaxID=672460 RepID=A0A2Y9C0N4_9MICO|nr:plasma-membrane proton-efflux P-type ATPase [Branchiibius hedensis]PWJ24095.1 H+-transporting ATPase [Branchiibius hedensis]SSA32913.1 H+-transporting ATPase [Branchiibius hedensis]